MRTPIVDMAPAPTPYVNHDKPQKSMMGAYDAAHVEERPTLVYLDGLLGSGVTAVALRFYWQNHERFPDGTITYDFSGGTLRNGPHDVPSLSSVLADFIRRCGVRAQDVAATYEGRRNQLRGQLTGKKMFILLENPDSQAQIEPFLAHAPGSVVVVTRHEQLSSLRQQGFERVPVDRLGEQDSRDLFLATAGHPRAELEEVLPEVLNCCAGSPKALLLFAGATWQASWKRAIRSAITGRNRTMRDDPVFAGLAANYATLTKSAARCLRTLAVHPGAEFSLPAVMAGMRTDEDEDIVDEWLRDLYRAKLIENIAEDRYRLIGQEREFAKSKLDDDEALKAQRPTVLLRFVDHYLRETVARDALLSDRWRVSPLYQAEGRPERITRVEALAWLEQERLTLRECVREASAAGWHDLAWQFCEALWGLYHLNGHFDDWIETHLLGVAAARAVGNAEAEMHLLNQLGAAHFAVGEYREAQAAFQDSLDVAANRLSGRLALFGQQSAWDWLGKIHREIDEHRTALEAFHRSEGFVRQLTDEDERARALALLDLQRGRTCLAMNDAANAVTVLEQAQAHFAPTTEIDNQGKCAEELAKAHHALGDGDQAWDHGESALAAFGHDGSHRKQANVCALLVKIARKRGDDRAAERYLTREIEHCKSFDPARANELAQSVDES